LKQRRTFPGFLCRYFAMSISREAPCSPRWVGEERRYSCSSQPVQDSTAPPELWQDYAERERPTHQAPWDGRIPVDDGLCAPRPGPGHPPETALIVLCRR
jgi:hypothetical protein